VAIPPEFEEGGYLLVGEWFIAHASHQIREQPVEGLKSRLPVLNDAAKDEGNACAGGGYRRHRESHKRDGYCFTTDGGHRHKRVRRSSNGARMRSSWGDIGLRTGVPQKARPHCGTRRSPDCMGILCGTEIAAKALAHIGFGQDCKSGANCRKSAQLWHRWQQEDCCI